MESKKIGTDEPSGRAGIKTQTWRMDLRTWSRGGGSWGEVRVALTYIHYRIKIDS